MKQTIGILLDHKTYRMVPKKRTGYEQISLYNNAANELRIEPFYMSLRQIGKTEATGYIYRAGRYIKSKRNIPKVIHNRAITLSPNERSKMKKLALSSTVFNRINRFSKYRVYRQLVQNKALRSYLPYTVKYSKSNLIKAMVRFPELYIKPTSGSLGSGIIKIKKKSDGTWNIYWKKGNPTSKSREQLIVFISRMIRTHSYLVQEGISLATYRGRQYDLRVSVQRGTKGKWQVTGMVGKVAAGGRHVTNVAKGGKIKRCELLFRAGGLPVDFTIKKVKRASLNIAAYLGKTLPHLADIGLDMGINRSGAVKFIEMNCRDQRYSFKMANMSSTFYNTYRTPLEYAVYLMNQKRKDK